MKADNKKLLIGFLIGVVITCGAFYVVDRLGERACCQSEEDQTCKNLTELPDNATKKITRVIDGDTFKIEGEHSVRLLGIDAAEEGHRCYEEAKQRLKEMVLNKKVVLERGNDNHDQYCRYLRYPFVGSTNVSLKLTEEGLVASSFYPGQTKYKDKITKAEQKAKENKRGCKWQTSSEEEKFDKKIAGGGSTTIELEANRTTGYEWYYNIENEGIIKVTSDDYEVDEHPEGMTGVGGTRIITIEGADKGTTTIKFEYYRSWKPEEIEKIKEIKIKVE